MSEDFSHFLIILAIYLKFLIQFFKLFSARRVSPDALSTILLKMKVLFLSLFPHFCMPLFCYSSTEEAAFEVKISDV